MNRADASAPKTSAMPRFDDACVPLLKTVMLQRVPDCCFLPEDVELITRQTGLSAAQVERWGMNIRFRYATFEEREDYLRKEKDDLEVSPSTGQLSSIGVELFLDSKS